MTTLGMSLTNLTVFLLHSCKCRCYVSRPILRPLPFQCRNTMIYSRTILSIVPPSNMSLGLLTLPTLKLDTFWNYSCYTAVSDHSFVVNGPMINIYDSIQTETISHGNRSCTNRIIMGIKCYQKAHMIVTFYADALNNTAFTVFQ